ncbi:SSI family serine proteinase inhibitor [Sinomonas sp. JGH33]|uniref:SSI family serine proteinase inhibitor n=1 Tax=Sinomonas terricola TaxID=3110330 RepID=A0ABU5T5Z1_9MICC|nr:SSI family serine proteinase inhibitor [Sinomonas sp. JGH33]MEA5454985.1 SSI family serine proteinase inhibitor [Sinomonas sp. JGH33]
MKVAVLSLGFLPLAAAALLAGCGGASGSGPGATSSAPTAPAASGTAAAELSIVVVHAPGQPEQRWTLRCAGATPAPGSSHPTAAAACALVAAHREILFPPSPPPDRACTMLYGGPDVATVTGTYDGAPVARRFSRTNGCETEDWNAATPLIGPPGNQ